jgi:hypothetical protein
LALLTKDILGAGGLDDDLSAQWGHTDFNTSISILSKFAGKKLYINKNTITKRKRGK